MTWVSHYGRPDLFITFTFNPNWEEIQTLLLPGQQSIHRHDVTARVFRQKLKSLTDLIVKSSVFGNTEPSGCILSSGKSEVCLMLKF